MQVDLTINTSNTQGICINAIPDASITADVKRVGLVEEFGDLGSPVARDNAAPVEGHQGKGWESLRYICQTPACMEVEAVQPQEEAQTTQNYG